MNQAVFENNTVNIIILSDRLPYYAESLYNLFTTCPDIRCSLITSADEFCQESMGIPDFLLVAGYLSNEENYGLLKKLRSINCAVYCLLLGRVDSVITSSSETYRFNDYFDRDLPNSCLLEHIRNLQNQIRNGFDYPKSSNSSSLVMKHRTYKISAYDNDSIIDIGSLGIRPAGPSNAYSTTIYYNDEYSFQNGMLTLSCLNLREEYGFFPDINGISPTCSSNTHQYDALNIPVPYTGTLILKRGCKEICDGAYFLTNMLFGCRQLLCLTLEKGRIVSCQNMSYICRKIRTLLFLYPILKHKKKLTPSQKTFLENHNYEIITEKPLLYLYYQKYFEACSHS